MRFLRLGLLVSLGCRQIEPAPTELDDLTHFFFEEFDGEESRLLEAGANLQLWEDANGSAEGTTGSVSDITPDDLQAVGMDPASDVTWITGVFELVGHPDCTLSDVEKIYLLDDQPSISTNEYEDYARSYLADPSCFHDGSCDLAEWEVYIETSLMGKTMSYTLVVQLRRVVGEDQTLILCRIWMPEPALVGDGDDGAMFFDQSYQIEAFLSQPDSSALHLYAIWNSGGLDGLSPDAELWERQYLTGLEDWNDRMDELCTTERALWE